MTRFRNKWVVDLIFIIFLTICIPSSQVVSAQTARIIYTVQNGTPIGIKNFAQPSLGCNYSGIGGQIFDYQGSPRSGLVVYVYGVLNGQSISTYGVSGSSPIFGPGGYLLTLGNKAVDSRGTLYLQVLDISGNTLTTPIPFNTYSSCSKNLIILNVAEGRIQNPVHLPQIVK